MQEDAGTVIEATGQPTSGATVELWSPQEKLASCITDSQGGFLNLSSGSTGVLLPITGLYWRATRLGWYFQRYWKYEKWFISKQPKPR